MYRALKCVPATVLAVGLAGCGSASSPNVPSNPAFPLTFGEHIRVCEKTNVSSDGTTGGDGQPGFIDAHDVVYVLSGIVLFEGHPQNEDESSKLIKTNRLYKVSGRTSLTSHAVVVVAMSVSTDGMNEGTCKKKRQ